MKKLQLIAFVLITSALFISCKDSKSVSKPDDLGKYVFDILKDFDNVTKDGYINTILTVEEIKAFGERNAETLDPKAKKSIDRLEKDEYDDRMGRDFNRIKEKAQKAGVAWDAIEYANYEFEERDENGMTSYRGVLTFKHADEAYSVRVIGVLLEGSYKLVRISSMRPAQ